MKLDEAQQQKVAGWVAEGLALADIQKRLASELGLSLTYMEVRFMVDDLKLVPKDAARPKEEKIPTLPGATNNSEDVRLLARKFKSAAIRGRVRGGACEPGRVGRRRRRRATGGAGQRQRPVQ